MKQDELHSHNCFFFFLFFCFSNLSFHLLYQWAGQWPEPCPPQRGYWCHRRGCRDSSAIGDNVVRNRNLDNSDKNNDNKKEFVKNESAWDKEVDELIDDLSGGMCAQICVSVVLMWTKKVELKINFFFDHCIVGWVVWAQVFIMEYVPAFFTGSNICFIIFFLSSFFKWVHVYMSTSTSTPTHTHMCMCVYVCIALLFYLLLIVFLIFFLMDIYTWWISGVNIYQIYSSLQQD